MTGFLNDDIKRTSLAESAVRNPGHGMLAGRLSIPVPKLMRTLERDKRGYPIPWIVLRLVGTPQFTVNDSQKVQDCLTKKLCAICGRRLMDGLWLVGGSRAFLHERGAFLDPPVHQECGEYALRVCPFLAASRYSNRIDGRNIDPANLPRGMILVRDEHMMPNLPERFGFGLTARVASVGSVGAPRLIVKEWHYIEWWRAGERINAPDTGVSPP